MLNWEYYLSAAFRIRLNYNGGEENNLARTWEGNRFLGDVYWGISCLMIRVIEKWNISMYLKLTITAIEERIAAVLFVDDADMTAEEDKAQEKIQLMAKTHNWLHSAARCIEDKKCKHFA